MTRSSVEADDDLLARASKAFGTETNEDTVKEALALAVRMTAFEAEVAFAKAGGYDDLLDPEVMRQAWR